MLKRIMLSLSAITLIFLLIGCAAENEPPATGSNEPKLEDTAKTDDFRISIVGGSVGGATGIIAEGVGEAIRKNCPNAVVTVKPGSDAENVVLVNQGDEQFGVCWGPTAYLGLQGMEIYDNKLENFAAVATVNIDAAQHYLVKKEVGLESLEQLKEEQFPLRVSVMRERNLAEVVNRCVLEAYGVTYDDIISWGGEIIHQGSGTTFEMMDDNKLDAFFTMLFFPASEYIEADTRYPVTLLPLSDKVIAEVADRLGMEKGVIPKESYPFIENDIPALLGNQVFIVNKDVPEEIVYSVTKALNEEMSYLNTVVSSMASLKGEHLPKVGKLPLHPGAEKYYREVGLLK